MLEHVGVLSCILIAVLFLSFFLMGYRYWCKFKLKGLSHYKKILFLEPNQGRTDKNVQYSVIKTYFCAIKKYILIINVLASIIKRKEFHCSKKEIDARAIDIEKILVSYECVYGEKKKKETDSSYFIEYETGRKTKSLFILLPQIIVIITSFFKVDFHTTFHKYKNPININLPIKAETVQMKIGWQIY